MDFTVKVKVKDRTPELDKYHEGGDKPAGKLRVSRDTLLSHKVFHCERGPTDFSQLSTTLPVKGERRSGKEHGDSCKVR